MCLKVVLLQMCFFHLYALSYKSLLNTTHHIIPPKMVLYGRACCNGRGIDNNYDVRRSITLHLNFKFI
jgi:hypothetical protein